MTLWAKYLLCKHEVLSSDPQKSCKTGWSSVCLQTKCSHIWQDGKQIWDYPQKLSGQTAWHVQWKTIRNSVSNKVEGEKQHLMLSSDLYMFYVSHKCPHSNMRHTPNTHECMHVCSWVCIHNIGSQKRWDRGKEGSKNLEQRWFGWNRTSYSAEQFADSTAAHREGSGDINWYSTRQYRALNLVQPLTRYVTLNYLFPFSTTHFSSWNYKHSSLDLFMPLWGLNEFWQIKGIQ